MATSTQPAHPSERIHSTNASRSEKSPSPQLRSVWSAYRGKKHPQVLESLSNARSGAEITRAVNVWLPTSTRSS